MKFYSVLEISEKLDIPKGKIYYKIRTDDDFKMLFKKDLKTGSYVLNCSDLELVANTFNISINVDKMDNKKNEKDLKLGLEDNFKSNFDEKTISLLEEEIFFLKEQLIEKDSQINKLLQITQNNQVLLLEEKSTPKINNSIVDKIIDFFRMK